MRGLSILLLLLVASSMAIVHAGPTDKFDTLATRLAQLLSNPANDARFNDINRFDDENDEDYFPKRPEQPVRQNMPKINRFDDDNDEDYFPKRPEQSVRQNKPKTVDASTQTSGEIIELAEKNETIEDAMATMFKSLIKIMAEMMRGVFKRR